MSGPPLSSTKPTGAVGFPMGTLTAIFEMGRGSVASLPPKSISQKAVSYTHLTLPTIYPV